jgi:hypothetical protein
MKKIILATLLIGFILGFAIPGAGAQESGEILSQDAQYTFGEELNFEINFSPDLEVESLTIFIQAVGIPTFVGAVSVPDQGQGYFSYNLAERPLPVFSAITYYYQFELIGGEIMDSPTYNFTYLDNRFNWQELVGEPFKIYWYEGDITLAQEVLDAAMEGQQRILELLQQPPDNQPITIFIYESEQDLQTSLANIGQDWVSGHADPAQGAMVVALPPAIDQPLEIQRLIPHELTHIFLYRFMGSEYQYLPAWLSEGLASQMEAYSLPEYEIVLENAHSENDLIPLAHICQAFPADQDLALLAYAQADSVVNYLQREYGLQALQALIYTYDQGVSCERGVEASLGLTIQDLDREWQQAVFGGGNLFLLIYILGAVLLVIILGLVYFIGSRMKSDPAEEDWGEDDYNYEIGLESDVGDSPLDQDISRDDE